MLPLDSTSTFIRSVFNGMSYGRGPVYGPGAYMRSQQMLASMLEQVRAFNDGKLTQYYDVIQTSRRGALHVRSARGVWSGVGREAVS